MLSMRNHSLYQSLSVSIFLLSLQGCAVLTQSQVDAVKEFSRAAKNYQDLPGSVINAHAEVMFAENIYAIASLKPEAPSLGSDPNSRISNKIDSGTEGYLQLLREAKKADAALNVIGRYVALLSKLSSDDFNDRLQQETVSLGTEIDGAVAEYNRISGENIDGFGSIIAATVRAGGGIFIRHKQTEALKEAVDRAESVIAHMSGAVVGLMNDYIGIDEQGGANIGYAQMAVDGVLNEYKGLLDGNRVKNSIRDVKRVSRLVIKAKSIKPLATKTKQAMLTFQKAHTRLHQKLQACQTLEGTIEEIEVLAGEVMAAKKLKDRIDND